VNPKFILAGIMLAGAINAPDATFARATDYVFQPVKATVKKGADVTLSVRLVNKATHKPVTDAEVTQAGIDMPGMAGMASSVQALPTGEPGVYAFKTGLSMEGRWLLSITAKVPGEPAAVVGKVTFKATK
jgi:hypothetical protein